MLYALLTLLLLPTAAVIALYASRIRFSKQIVARTVPAQSSPARCRRTIVIAGDSTAFGVGALPEHSTAGRLAAAFPHARVINVARSGARVGHVFEQLARLVEPLARCGCRKVDFVLIHACGNDVIEFRSVDVFEQDLRAAIAMARQLSDNVVLMPGQNFSVAPFFLRGLSHIVTRHAVRLHAVVERRFLTEDVRAMAEADGFASAPDGRAWGAVMRAAARKGIVIANGYAPAKSSNCSAKVLWLSMVVA